MEITGNVNPKFSNNIRNLDVRYLIFKGLYFSKKNYIFKHNSNDIRILHSMIEIHIMLVNLIKSTQENLLQ